MKRRRPGNRPGLLLNFDEKETGYQFGSPSFVYLLASLAIISDEKQLCAFCSFQEFHCTDDFIDLIHQVFFLLVHHL